MILDIRQRAESGEVLAQIMLGFLLEHGLSMSRDKEEAQRWYEGAAEKGSPAGQYALARLVAEDDPKAMITWLRKAADAGYPPAQFQLGWSYELGKGVETNLKSAVCWVNRAADGGFIPAIMHLSHMYEEGVGVEVDKEKAMDIVRRAAEAGDAGAAYLLGTQLIQEGKESEREEALDWIWKAAQDGQKFTHMFLAHMYGMGLYGATKDKRLANYFLSKSKLKESDLS